MIEFSMCFPPVAQVFNVWLGWWRPDQHGRVEAFALRCGGIPQNSWWVYIGKSQSNIRWFRVPLFWETSIYKSYVYVYSNNNNNSNSNDKYIYTVCTCIIICIYIYTYIIYSPRILRELQIYNMIELQTIHTRIKILIILDVEGFEVITWCFGKIYQP